MGAMLELIVGSFEKRERLPALQFSCCFMYFFFAFGAMHFLFLLDLSPSYLEVS